MADVSLDTDSNDPHELYARGIRALILQNYEAASAIISKAAELFVDYYKDDLHPEMGKVYLDYGKALLGYCREQSGALGCAVPKESLDEPDEDEGACTEEMDVSGACDPEEVEDNEEPESHDEPKETASCSAEPGPSIAEAEMENTSIAEEPTDLQLAWEVLELAKRIFEKSGDRKSLAEAMIVLGEIQLENAAYDKAIQDMTEGLAIQQELFGRDSRTVAETLYKLGMAYCINSQVNEAIHSFKESLAYLTNKIMALAAEDVSKSEFQDEITEIKGLLPEIKDRIFEMEAFKNEALKKAAEKITETSSSAASDPSPSSSKKATDISHLVKRKRQSEEVDKLSEEAACKKREVEGKS
uniref:Tetratricopeptide SHNi-TPR domain-containing protein n=1 Tax=Dendroctonus ponderosae TaxID=77166 RepID=J3JVU2_DENPD|nr:unknown [Dendroctonus ponderosae]